MVFVDREADLQEMERRWGARPQFQLLWGRRRVGKSALIRRFADGKDAIVFQAVAGTVTDQLDLLTRRILAWRSDPELEGSPLSNWARTFAFLERVGRERKASGEPLLVVLDEFQYLAKTDKTVISRLSDFYGVVKHEELPLFIIISGSAISFFERQVEIGGVFGRRTFGGLLPPLGLMHKRITGGRGATLIGSLVGIPFRVRAGSRGPVLVYAGPLGLVRDRLRRRQDGGWDGEATVLGVRIGRFRMTRKGASRPVPD